MNQFYPKILKHIILPVTDKVMKTKLISNYKKIRNMQEWDKYKIENWQNEKLQKLVLFAYNNTEYYKELFDTNSISPHEIKTKEDLIKIPILKKKDIINNYSKLMPDNLQKKKYITSSTGGSTGDPMKFLLDIDSWSFSNANSIINWEKTTYNYGNKFVALGSTSINVKKKQSLKHTFYYRLKNKVGLSGINMSDEVCQNYLEIIDKNKIKFIYGYASAIYLLAKYAKKHSIKTSIKACFPTSEILTQLYRETITNTFNCTVVNCYGAHDGGVTAFEHESGFFEVGYNCIVRTKEKNNDMIGSALLTDLYNYAMPMINYQLGDEFQIDIRKSENYSYNGQIINNVLGRTSDLIMLDNGSILTGPGFTVLFTDLPVEAYSIHKIGPNSILCRIKKMTDFSNKDEETIRLSLQNQAGIDAIIKLEYVDKFELLKSGKRKYFFSN
jgi:phenylacetate-CoA ligase